MARIPKSVRELLAEALDQPGGAVYVEDMLRDYLEDTEQAARFYKRFHWGNEPETLETVAVPRVVPGEVVVQLGELVELSYEADKGGELAIWVHAFRNPRPVLAYTLSGGLVIAGGGYRVTDRGIVG